MLSTGQAFQSSFKEMLSGFLVKTNPLAARADALQIVYFIKKATNEEEDRNIHNFETSFESYVLSVIYRSPARLKKQPPMLCKQSCNQI